MRTSVSASMRPPGRWIEQSWPDTRSISAYSWIVYCWRRATFGSPFRVCMPPAACHVDPAVSSRRSSRTTSFQPALVRWYRTLAPTTPPPMTTAWNSFFIDPLSVVGRDAALGDAPGDERIELLEDGRIHRRWLVGRQQLLPDPVRLRGEFRRAGLLPRLVVAPVAEHRLVECRLVAGLRVLGAEEVAARA